MMRAILMTMAMLLGFAVATPAAWAEIDGHGPDAWRVTGVAADDVLNMRMGPGTDFLVIDHLAPDARQLEQITCVPLLIPSIYNKLSDKQRAALPSRWCLMRSSDFSKAGWVAQRFLMEDGLAETVPGAVTDQGAASQDPLIEEARRLVRDLYTAFEMSESQSGNPFAPANARRYFFADIVPALHGRGADLLYDAQDFQGEVTRIAPDADEPMLRGMITIDAVFTNFGRQKHATFRLRADTAQSGAPVRIFRIEHDGWSFPQ